MATVKEILLIKEIAGLCVEINCMGKYSVFMDFSGHVNWIEVRLGGVDNQYNKEVEGWSGGDNYKLSDGDYYKPKECVKRFESLRDRLTRIRDGLDSPAILSDAIASKLRATEVISQ